MTNTYVNPITGQTISPSQVGYEALTISVDTELDWPINGTTSTDVVAAIIQVTATVDSLLLYMPSALQVSTGQSVLIQNIGAETFTVTDISGNVIVGIASGVAEYIFLTDNSTDDGTWSTVTFGAGTSTSNAAALAGYGLVALPNIGLPTLNQAYPESSVFSSTALNGSYRAQFLVWEGGVGALTLPSASGAENGWFIMVRNGGSGILTLTPSGTDTIDTLASQQLQLTESLVIVSNGVDGYSTFAYGRSNTFAYTQLSKSVTGGTTTLTAVEYANVVQEYSGVLLSNQIVVLPSTVQIYYLNNQTTGSFTLTFKTSAVSAATVTVPQSQTLTVICDGTNVFNSNSAAGGTLTSLTINPGSAAAPSLNFAGNITTGLYQPATNQIGFSVGAANAATITASEFLIPVGISGGAF
jgi:hypothetical protein